MIILNLVRANLEVLDALEQRETKEKMQFINHCQVPQDQGVREEVRGCQGSRVQKEIQDTLEFLVLLAYREQRVILDCLVLMVFLEEMVRLDQLEFQVLREMAKRETLD